MNFRQLEKHFSDIYGVNNCVYITSLSERVNLLLTTVRSLQDAVRKKGDKKTLARTLANVVSRAFAVADHFRSLDLARAMCMKYPNNGCGYCKEFPCTCPDHERGRHTEYEPEKEQLLWSLSQHQDNLGKLYGRKNRESGIENCLNRLSTEISEVIVLQAGVSMAGFLASEILREYARELADVFAWIIAVAVILDIDLEESVMAVYGQGCPTCSGHICRCHKYVVVGDTVFHNNDVHPHSVQVGATDDQS